MALELFLSLTNLLWTFVICLGITTVIFKWYSERDYPPGPVGIPVLGYSVFLGKKPHEKLRDLSRKYGDVFSFYLGSDLYICLNDYHVVKELLTNPKLMFRPEHIMDFMVGRGGFGGMNGEGWQEQRRFTFYTMRNLGMGKGLWETMIQEGVADFIEDLKTKKGQPTTLEDALAFAQASNGISLLLGRHLDKEKDTEKIEIIRQSTEEFMKYFGQLSVNVGMPWLRKFMEVFRLAGYEKFFDLLRKFETIFQKEVEERMKSPESLTRDDYIGCFFREMQKREDDSKEHSFTIENLLGNLMILFISSNDSTLASVSWLVLLMAQHPDVQKRVHDEIDSVAGRDGVISFDDKAKFPYTMATIFEMLRWASVAPLYPARLVIEDMTVRGYTIPKGAFIIVNIWSIMRDVRYFKDPEKFLPERFLSEDNKVIKSMDGYAPFSVGKRNCPGEGVAIMTVFLYFVSLLQKFKVAVPPGKTIDLEPVSGGALKPNSQEMCFVER